MTFPAELLSTYASLEPGRTDEALSETEKDWETKRREMETILGRGNWIFWAVSAVDRDWHLEIFENRTPYNPKEQKDILDYYAAWLQPAAGILSEIDALEARGYRISGAEQFRRNYSEARGLLSDDGDFFKDDAFVESRDRAIDAHREGQSGDFHVFGE